MERIVISGLLVGYGTNLSNGCSSGHGICGLSSLRFRSLVAVMTFMVSAMVTTMASNTIKYAGNFINHNELTESGGFAGVGIGISFFLILLSYLLSGSNDSPLKPVFVLISEALFGVAFAFGLGVSNMTRNYAAINFFDLRYWNPALAFVMGGAICISLPSFYYMNSHLKTPLLDTKFFVSSLKDLDAKLIIGAICYGVGWGILGICPGPAIVNLGSGNIPPIIFCSALLFGNWVKNLQEILFPQSNHTHSELPNTENKIQEVETTQQIGTLVVMDDNDLENGS